MEILVAIVAIITLLIGVPLSLSLVVWLIYKKVKRDDPNETSKPAKQEQKQPDPPKGKTEPTEKKTASKEKAPSWPIGLMWGGLILAGIASIASLFVVYITFKTQPKADTANSPTYRPITASLDNQLNEYGNCESPGEPGGKQWEDEEKKIPVKGKKDPDDTGALQINTRIHADLIKETGIDPAKSKEDNYRLGKVILERYLANPSAYKEHPWEASRYCWEPVLTGSSLAVDRLAPKTLDLKAGVWSKPEKNKTTATPKKLYWFTKNLDCKVKVDGNEHPITVDLKGTVPDQYEFMCPSDTEIKLEWF